MNNVASQSSIMCAQSVMLIKTFGCVLFVEMLAVVDTRQSMRKHTT